MLSISTAHQVGVAALYGSGTLYDTTGHPVLVLASQSAPPPVATSPELQDTVTFEKLVPNAPSAVYRP